MKSNFEVIFEIIFETLIWNTFADINQKTLRSPFYNLQQKFSSAYAKYLPWIAMKSKCAIKLIDLLFTLCISPTVIWFLHYDAPTHPVLMWLAGCPFPSKMEQCLQCPFLTSIPMWRQNEHQKSFPLLAFIDSI